MSRERFRFERQVAGRGAFAEVEVRILTSPGAGQNVVTVSDDAFGTARSAAEAEENDAYRVAAHEGVTFALENVSPRVEASVLVSFVGTTAADTTADAVRFAAAHATWRLIGGKPTKRLTVHGVELES